MYPPNSSMAMSTGILPLSTHGQGIIFYFLFFMKLAVCKRRCFMYFMAWKHNYIVYESHERFVSQCLIVCYLRVKTWLAATSTCYIPFWLLQFFRRLPHSYLACRCYTILSRIEPASTDKPLPPSLKKNTFNVCTHTVLHIKHVVRTNRPVKRWRSRELYGKISSGYLSIADVTIYGVRVW